MILSKHLLKQELAFAIPFTLVLNNKMHLNGCWILVLQVNVQELEDRLSILYNKTTFVHLINVFKSFFESEYWRDPFLERDTHIYGLFPNEKQALIDFN